MIHATLKKLSVCECGFPLLHDEIPLGTDYLVNPGRRAQLTIICGGCKREFKLPSIWAAERHGKPGGNYLPEEIFEYEGNSQSLSA